MNEWKDDDDVDYNHVRFREIDEELLTAEVVSVSDAALQLTVELELISIRSSLLAQRRGSFTSQLLVDRMAPGFLTFRVVFVYGVET